MRLGGKLLMALCLLLPSIARAQSIPVAPSLTSPNAGGGVNFVNSGTGITITGSSTNPAVNLSNTAVTPGAYTNLSATVDAQGRLTAASNGSNPGLGLVNGYINVTNPTYGAKGDGTTDDTAAIQSAIAASCASGTNKPPVYLPPTPGSLCYKTSSPLLLNCSTAFTGPQASLNSAASICQNYLGPAIISQGADPSWKPPLASSVTATRQPSTAYVQFKEILDSNGNVEFVKTAGTTGAGGSPVWPTIQGNTVADGTVTWQLAMVGTQLATGAGSALDTLSQEFFPGAGYGSNNGFVELSNSGWIDRYANGASAFTVEFYVMLPGLGTNWTAQSVYFFGAEPGQPMPSNIPAVRIYLPANGPQGSCPGNCVAFSADIGGVNKSAQSAIAAGAFNSGVTQHFALTYDGATVRLFLQGTLVASVAATGTWTVPAYESWMLNDPLPQCYPGACGSNNGLYAAYYDSLRISNNARYTANFTAPTAKFATDANTIFLLNFPTNAPTGTIQAFNGSTNKNVYIPIAASQGNAILNPAYIGNLVLNDNGIWANWMDNSTIENIKDWDASQRTCVFLANNDYQDTVRRVFCASGYNDGATRVGFLFGNQSNNNVYDHLQCDGQHSCIGQLGGSGTYILPDYTDRGDLIYGFYFVGAQALLESPTLDDEVADSAFLADVYSSGAYAPIEIHGGQLLDVNSGVGSNLAISGGQPFVVTGTQFGGTPAQFLNVLSAPTQPVTVKDAVVPAVARTNASNGQYLSIQQNGKDEQSTVNNLWTCGTVNKGSKVIPTNCTTCTFGATCTDAGGGGVFCPEVCNASAWAAY